jgi:hypothetical protein
MVNFFIFTLRCPSTSNGVAVPLATLHVVVLDCLLLVSICISGACEARVVCMHLIAMGTEVIFIVGDREIASVIYILRLLFSATLLLLLLLLLPIDAAAPPPPVL